MTHWSPLTWYVSHFPVTRAARRLTAMRFVFSATQMVNACASSALLRGELISVPALTRGRHAVMHTALIVRRLRLQTASGTRVRATLMSAPRTCQRGVRLLADPVCLSGPTGRAT